jgi:restriction system protein
MIPDYESIMLPLLKIAADGKEHRISDVVQQLQSQFGLTDDERMRLLPSGKQTIIANRAHWAKTYMAQAGLLQSTRRGHFTITARGRGVLSEPLESLDRDYLSRFPEFKEFQTRTRSGETDQRRKNVTPDQITPTQTPDEIVRATVAQIENALRKELLSRILNAPPAFFEGLIVNLLLAMGYGGSRREAGQIVGRSGDGGIDGIIDQDALGLERVYVQAKRYATDNGVSEPEIRAFSGSLGANKADKGVFVTTSYFTQPAATFAERHPFRIVLIDGDALTALMIRHNVGVRVDETWYLKKIDEDFFTDE